VTRPQTTWVGFTEGWVANFFREAEQALFASFSGKRRVLYNKMCFWKKGGE
jgi:hypothetical protein